MLCYRYMNFQNAKWSLEDGWFKTSRPSEFNDPFDCRANIKGVPSERVLKEYVDLNFKRLRERILLINPALANVNIGRGLILEKLRHRTDWADEVMTELLEGCDAVARIICFSCAAVKDEHSDNLMWGHYADKGAGVRIGFDLDDLKNTGCYLFDRVHYDKVMPTFDLSKLKKWPKEGVSEPEFLFKCMYTKDSSWEYEDEVRMIIPRNHPMHPWMFQERLIEGKKLDFFHLPYSAIRSVDFGVRADIGQCKKLVASIRSNDKARHISFKRATLCDDIYGYRFVGL